MLPDGRIAFCDGTHGRLLVLDDAGSVDVLGEVGGSPNGLALGDDGSLYAALTAAWHPLNAGSAPAVVRHDPDGTTTVVATGAPSGPFVAPNDLAFGPDGELLFTDSGDLDYLRPTGPGRIHAVDASGARDVLELEPCYVNGIGFEPTGALLWTETATRRVRRRSGEQISVVAHLDEPDLPDGFAVAADGRIFVATVTGRAIVVLAPDGNVDDRIDVGAEPTNCAFRGSTLIVTASTDSSGDPGTGCVLAVDTDATPLALHTGSVREEAAR